MTVECSCGGNTRMSFVEALADARASVVTNPADAVIVLLMQEFGIREDPRDGIGYQDEWYHRPVAVDMAIRVMVQGFGMTQRDAAWRMGYSPGRASNAHRPPTLDDDELDLYDAACELVGKAR